MTVLFWPLSSKLTSLRPASFIYRKQRYSLASDVKIIRHAVWNLSGSPILEIHYHCLLYGTWYLISKTTSSIGYYLFISKFTGTVVSEGIEWFIEDQANLRSYDLAPRPPPSTFSRQEVVSRLLSHPLTISCLSFSVFLFLCVPGRGYRFERGGGGGRGAKSYDREKAWSSINQSLLSG